MNGKLGRRIKNLESLTTQHEEMPIQKKLGYSHAFPFYRFVLWVMESCKSRGIKKIYYCTREGELFQKIHNIICEQRENVDWPASHLLEVSRMATFLPSLHSCEREGFQRLWSQYQEQSVVDFFCTLNLPYEEAQPFLMRYDISKNDRINGKKDSICNLWRDRAFVSWLSERAQKTRELLVEYLQKKNIHSDIESFTLVDIGWRGTIQDNLCYILNNTKIIGFYFGLLPMLNSQPENAEKIGFCNQFTAYKSAVVLKSPTPIEFLTNSDKASVVGYQKIHDQVIPKCYVNPSEANVFTRFVRDFQQGILQLSYVLATSVVPELSLKDSLDYCYKKLVALLCYPSKESSICFFSFSYNELFGLGKIVESKIKRESLLKEIRQMGIRQFLNSTRWPQAYLRMQDMGWMLPIYNCILIIQEMTRRKG